MDSPQPTPGSRRATLSLGQFLLAEFAILALCLAAMVWVGLQGLASSQYYLARCSAAQEQLALANRLEAKVGMMLIARRSGRSYDLHRKEVSEGVQAYRAATEREIALVTRQGFSAAEEREEQRGATTLAAIVKRIEADGGANGARLAELQHVIHTIAEREQQEVAEAARDMDMMRVHSTHLGTIILVIAALVAAVAAVLLWQWLVRPMHALGVATAALSADGGNVRVTPRGLAEVRDLATLFNDMAAEIERQVQARTAELAASNARLTEIDRSRRLFFAKVSHELRTPLTVILGEADVALRNQAAPREALREALDHVGANGAFLQRRLDDLLATARSEDGLIQLAFAPVDLAGVIGSAVEIVAPFARSSGVEIAARPPEEPISIEGDDGWLRQALLAVLDNAVKFAGADGKVAITGSREAECAIVRIADNGPGVDEGELPHLFDPYFRGERARAHSGSGLGLALARWIVERHRGTITAHQATEGGLLIEIVLPVCR